MQTPASACASAAIPPLPLAMLEGLKCRLRSRPMPDPGHRATASLHRTYTTLLREHIAMTDRWCLRSVYKQSHKPSQRRTVISGPAKNTMPVHRNSARRRLLQASSRVSGGDKTPACLSAMTSGEATSVPLTVLVPNVRLLALRAPMARQGGRLPRVLEYCPVSYRYVPPARDGDDVYCYVRSPREPWPSRKAFREGGFNGVLVKAGNRGLRRVLWRG
ncbi:uncharacterized protein LY79DRAFT_201834 [Colletotrichum navitas]|uniref:Uncharacterized protein n=1 Tax=Colletotrichum navitas TaxID=681940 RepID=A0AAD8VBB9_9PEZI|nr:uncharacterized protein LY79DRAFT_201834 [Colletotrichum navitas]KAK1598893.1 hypothetical protein LY79DRAFT_201834 [Colletotrichum navitas]